MQVCKYTVCMYMYVSCTFACIVMWSTTCMGTLTCIHTIFCITIVLLLYYTYMCSSLVYEGILKHFLEGVILAVSHHMLRLV